MHWIVAPHRAVEGDLAFPNDRFQFRRQAAWINRIAAGQGERQAEAKGFSQAHFFYGFENARLGQQVEAADLIVGAEIAPVRTLGPYLSTLAHIVSLA